MRIGESKPDSIVLISYYADGAQIVRAHIATLPIAAVGSVYSPKFLELGGTAVDGVYTESNFFPAEPRPEVQAFVQRYRAKFHADPDSFVARAYDALILSAEVLRRYGTTRHAHDGFAKISDVPSVIFGKVRFDPQTRRVAGARTVYLVVKQGQWALGRRETAARRALTPALNSMHVTDAS